MYTLIISNFYDDTRTAAQFLVGGCEAAYLAFRKACEMCELTGGSVILADAETGEVVADNWEEDEFLLGT